MVVVTLPCINRSTEDYELGDPGKFEVANLRTMPRIAYAAVHVVADPVERIITLRSTPPSIGKRQLTIDAMCGRLVSALLKLWTRHSAVWV